VGAMSRYLDWLDEARDDLESAEYLLNGGRYSKACFYAQQAAEKAVKALLNEALWQVRGGPQCRGSIKDC